MSFAHKLKTTLLRAYLLKTVTIGLDLFFFAYLLKRLPAEEVGFYSWVTAVIVFASLLLNMGLEQVLVRDLSGPVSVGKAIGGALQLRFFVVLVEGLVFLGWVLFFGPPRRLYLSVVLMGLVQVAFYVEAIFLSYLRSRERQDTCNVLLTLNAALRLVAGVLVMEFLGLKSALYVIAGVLGAKLLNLALVFVSYLLARRRIEDRVAVQERFDRRKYLKASFSFLGINTLTALRSRADWLLVHAWIGGVALANYSLANKFYEVSTALWATVLVNTYPWHCRIVKEDSLPRRFHLFVGVYFLCSLFLGGLIYTLGPLLVGLIFADKYVLYEAPLKVFSVVFIIGSLNSLIRQLLVAGGHESKILRLSFIITFLQITVDLYAIPRYGIVGASFGMLVSWSVYLVFFIKWGLRLGYLDRVEIWKLVPAALAIIVAWGGAVLATGGWYRPVIMIASFPPVLFLFYLRGSDRRFIFDLFGWR